MSGRVFLILGIWVMLFAVPAKAFQAGQLLPVLESLNQDDCSIEGKPSKYCNRLKSLIGELKIGLAQETKLSPRLRKSPTPVLALKEFLGRPIFESLYNGLSNIDRFYGMSRREVFELISCISRNEKGLYQACSIGTYPETFQIQGVDVCQKYEVHAKNLSLVFDGTCQLDYLSFGKRLGMGATKEVTEAIKWRTFERFALSARTKSSDSETWVSPQREAEVLRVLLNAPPYLKGGLLDVKAVDSDPMIARSRVYDGTLTSHGDFRPNYSMGKREGWAFNAHRDERFRRAIPHLMGQISLGTVNFKKLQPNSMIGDIKPDNILIKFSTDGVKAVHGDFDTSIDLLEHCMSEEKSQPVVGTPDFTRIADFLNREWPEGHKKATNCPGEVARRQHQDVFSQGLVFYTLLHGKLPWLQKREDWKDKSDSDKPDERCLGAKSLKGLIVCQEVELPKMIERLTKSDNPVDHIIAKSLFLEKTKPVLELPGTASVGHGTTIEAIHEELLHHHLKIIRDGLESGKYPIIDSPDAAFNSRVALLPQQALDGRYRILVVTQTGNTRSKKPLQADPFNPKEVFEALGKLRRSSPYSFK